MRRLPVFLVVDVSESMAGTSLRQMQDGIRSLCRTLRADPHALESVFISVIAFAGVARTLVPLVDVASFEPPLLPIGGGTSLGAAMEHLMTAIEREVVPATPERKGDWRPIVFLFTDGKPTDAPGPSLSRWKQRFGGRAELVAVALGPFADVALLQSVTEHTMVLGNTTEADFRSLIQWVSASVLTHSRSVGSSGDRLLLARSDASVLRLETPLAGSGPVAVDPDHVVLTGRCQRRRAPYLMKYERVRVSEVLRGRPFEVTVFRGAGCYALTEAYFEWSDPGAPEQTINTGELVGGAPPCPHCGAATAFAQCACGGLLCIDGPGEATCPWCARTVLFEQGGGEFDVRRGRG